MLKKALLFDFDLTLADSSQGIFQCVNYAMKQLGFQAYNYYIVKNVIGHPLPDTFKLLTGNGNAEKAKEFTTLFVEHADKVMNNNTFIFPEVFDVIPKMKERGFQLGIVSTKYRYRIAGILERDNLIEYFDLIIGGEDVKEHKPNPEGLFLAIQKLGVDKNEVFYIGDTLIDAETAQRAEVDFIGVLTGTTTMLDFQSQNVTNIIKDLNFLSAKIKGH